MDTKQVINKMIVQKEPKQLILGLVIDATLSASEVYPQMFYFLEHMLMCIQQMRKTLSINVEYSVILLHDKPELLPSSQASMLWEKERMLTDALADISFYGGSRDGTEELGDAVREQLKEMNQRYEQLRADNPKRSISQQMIFITDACTKKAERSPDFTKGERGTYGDYTNYGLQQAVVISYDAAYMPNLRIVNSGFSLTENGKNRCMFGDLKDLLNMNEAETLQAAEKMAERIVDIAID